MGGTIGAPWKALLRREFAALRDGERAEIELAVAQHVKQSNCETHKKLSRPQTLSARL